MPFNSDRKLVRTFYDVRLLSQRDKHDFPAAIVKGFLLGIPWTAYEPKIYVQHCGLKF